MDGVKDGWLTKDNVANDALTTKTCGSNGQMVYGAGKPYQECYYYKRSWNPFKPSSGLSNCWFKDVRNFPISFSSFNDSSMLLKCGRNVRRMELVMDGVATRFDTGIEICSCASAVIS